jgi:hypothetical protein
MPRDMLPSCGDNALEGARAGERMREDGRGDGERVGGVFADSGLGHGVSACSQPWCDYASRHHHARRMYAVCSWHLLVDIQGSTR